MTDPVAANNAATDTDSLTPQADLALAIADDPDPVAPGAPLVYTLHASNLGPSRSPGMTLTSVPDASLVDFVSSVPGPPICTYAAGTLLGAIPAGMLAAPERHHELSYSWAEAEKFWVAVAFAR